MYLYPSVTVASIPDVVAGLFCFLLYVNIWTFGFVYAYSKGEIWGGRNSFVPHNWKSNENNESWWSDNSGLKYVSAWTMCPDIVRPVTLDTPSYATLWYAKQGSGHSFMVLFFMSCSKHIGISWVITSVHRIWVGKPYRKVAHCNQCLT